MSNLTNWSPGCPLNLPEFVAKGNEIRRRFKLAFEQFKNSPQTDAQLTKRVRDSFVDERTAMSDLLEDLRFYLEHLPECDALCFEALLAHELMPILTGYALVLSDVLFHFGPKSA
jgi:hypothetical protein